MLACKYRRSEGSIATAQSASLSLLRASPVLMPSQPDSVRCQAPGSFENICASGLRTRCAIVSISASPYLRYRRYRPVLSSDFDANAFNIAPQLNLLSTKRAQSARTPKTNPQSLIHRLSASSCIGNAPAIALIPLISFSRRRTPDTNLRTSRQPLPCGARFLRAASEPGTSMPI